MGQIKIALLILSIVGALSMSTYFYMKGKRECEKANEILTQSQQLKIQNEIISTKDKIREIQKNAVLATPNDNLKWLQENRCIDCQS